MKYLLKNRLPKVQFILLVLLLSLSDVKSQDNSSNIFGSICIYDTKGTGETYGASIKFPYPCNWKEIPTDKSTTPNIIKQFFHGINDETIIAEQLLISHQNVKYDDAKKICNSMDSIRKYVKGLGGELISANPLNSKTHLGVRVILKHNSGNIHIRNLQYMIFENNKVYVLAFSTMANDYQKAYSAFSKFENDFDRIAATFKIDLFLEDVKIGNVFDPNKSGY